MAGLVGCGCVTLILHYPQPHALSHVVGNPFAVDYCNPTEGLNDTSDHDKSQSPAACHRCTSSKNRGINLRYDLTYSLVHLTAVIGGAWGSFAGPLDSSSDKLTSA